MSALGRKGQLKLDWISIVLFLLLVGFGYFNILSASSSGEITSYLDMSQPYGKQLVFIFCTLVLIVLILAIEAKFYERFASLIYLVGIASLLGLFLFGKNVNGATSWYALGGMTIQPSEFAKFATALAVAKYISDLQTNIKDIRDQIKAVLIILVPAILIVLQNDAGSTIVYAAFFFVFYREGIPQVYLFIGLTILIVAVLTLKFSVLVTAIAVTLIVFIHHFTFKKKRSSLLQPIFLTLICVVFSLGVQFFYKSILQPHQQDRISLWLRLEKILKNWSR